MFCKNCGNQLAEGSLFCGKCGARVEAVLLDPQGKPLLPQQPAASAPPQNPPAAQKQESSGTNGILAFLGLAGVVLLFIFGLKTLLTPRTHYIEMVKSCAPISAATYEELVSSCCDNASWSSRKGENGICYVDISGAETGSEMEFVLTIRMEPTENSTQYWISPYRVTINGQSGGAEAAGQFVQALEMAYQYGSSVSDLMSLFTFFSFFE